MGGKTKFKKEYLVVIENLCKRGATDKDLAEAFSVTETTINNWKKAFPESFKSIKDWKKIADKGVERALYESAVGFEHPEEKIFCQDGKIIRAKTVKKYPPNDRSIRFWLTNRKPEEYRERSEVDITSKGRSIVDRIREQMNNDEPEKG